MRWQRLVAMCSVLDRKGTFTDCGELCRRNTTTVIAIVQYSVNFESIFDFEFRVSDSTNISWLQIRQLLLAFLCWGLFWFCFVVCFWKISASIFTFIAVLNVLYFAVLFCCNLSQIWKSNWFVYACAFILLAINVSTDLECQRKIYFAKC